MANPGNGTPFDASILQLLTRCPELSRRQFTQWLLGTGAAIGALGGLPACGGSSASGAGRQADGATRPRTLHFDLAHLPADQRHVLHAGGVRHELIPHSAESRAHWTALDPSLAAYPSERITHHVPDVPVLAAQTQRLHVTTHGADRSGLVAVFLHLPEAAPATAARRPLRQPRTVLDGAPVDHPADNMIAAYQTAQALVCHHPEVLTREPEVARAVRQHLEESVGVLNLALSILAQGPAYVYADGRTEGWCRLVPLHNADGTPRLDSDGEPLYRHDLSEATEAALRPALLEVLAAIKDDPALTGRMHQVNYATGTDGTADGMEGGTARAAASSAYSMSCDHHGYHHNVLLQEPTVTDRAGRQFSIGLMNVNFLYYSLFVEYLDAGNRPISRGDYRTTELSDLAADLRLANDTLNFTTLVGPPTVVLGVPIPTGVTRYDFTLPDGAAAARLKLCGPGFGLAGASVEDLYFPSLVPGIVMTLIFQYALPSVFLAAAVGEQTEVKATDLLSPMEIVKLVPKFGATLLSVAEGDGAALLRSVVSLIGGLVNTVVEALVKGEIVTVGEYLAVTLTEEELETAIPFIGWGLRAVLIATTVADMAATTAEIVANPAVIETTVRFTHDLTLAIHRAPGTAQLPEVATRCDIFLHFNFAQTRTQRVQLTTANRYRDPLEVTLAGVPLTHDVVEVRVVLHAENGWIAARASAEFDNRAPTDGGGLTVSLTLEEFPVRLDADTVYQHERKLAWAGGPYWHDGAAPPQPAAPVCLPDHGLCELGNFSLCAPGEQLGYSWRAGGLTEQESPGAGQLHTFQLLSLSATAAIRSPGCGFDAPTPVLLDPEGKGRDFFLEPVGVRPGNPEYHLRRIDVDAADPLASPRIDRSRSWGYFNLPLERLQYHPNGYVVGMARRFGKIAVLPLPKTGSADHQAPVGTLLLGPGQRGADRICQPRGLAVSQRGALLVLEGRERVRIKAFTVGGQPWKYFSGNQSSVLDLMDGDQPATWLDLAVDPTDRLFVLSHTDDGSHRHHYRLDVYDALDGSHILRNTGIAAERIAVDTWRTLYTLNREPLAGAPTAQPSVSVWVPETPV